MMESSVQESESGIQPQVPESVSREVLRWIQSLDLAYSVKNVRRDFSNGFLIAEIFSRYYQTEIQMHSYENGAALRIKKANWHQLMKVLGRLGLSEMASDHEVQSIIHCEQGTVVTLLNRMYERLTERSVQKVQRRPLPVKTPAYARENGAAAVRRSARSAALAETHDERTKRAQLAHCVDMHELSLQEDRSMLTPPRKSPVFNEKRSIKNESSITTSSTTPQVSVKHIHVRQIEKSAAQIRSSAASGTLSTDNFIDVVPRDLEEVLCEALLDVEAVRSHANALNQEESADMLDLLATICGVKKSTSIDQKMTANDQKSTAIIFDKLIETAKDIANACSETESVARIAGLALGVMLQDAAPAETFEKAALFLAAFGHLLSDDYVAWVRAEALPALVPLLRLDGMEMRRRFALEAMYAFAHSADQKITTIKRLQNDLQTSPNAFLACAAHLARIDLASSSLKESRLRDLHLYYVSVCLAQPEVPGLHAAATAALAGSVNCLAAYLPTLALLASSDKFWETQAQLVVLAAKALVPTSPYFSAPEMRDTLLCILHEAFHPTALPPVRAVGLAAIATLLASDHNDQQDQSVKQAFVAVLLAETDAELRVLFGSQDDELDRLCGARLMSNLEHRPLPLHAILDSNYIVDLLNAYATPGPALERVLRLLG